MRPFRDRLDAAKQLAVALGRFKPESPLVLAIPRGSVPMGRQIAEEIGSDLDVVLVHKVGAPGNPEYAIGAVSEYGDIFLSDTATYFDEPYLTAAAQEEIEKLRRRRQEYTPIHPPRDPAGRTVILIDDGIATGATMLSAVRAVRKRGARRVIVATPVAGPEVAERFKGEADEFIALHTPMDFFAVSQFYEEFEQVTDEEVRKTLLEFRPPPGVAA